MAIHDVECCEEYQTHEELLKLVHEQMPDEDELYDLAELFKVFGDSIFWYLMYLYSRFIRCCRCSFLDRCICKTLIFTIADALLGTNVSATYFSLNLQMLFSLSTILNCIYIPHFR